MRHIKTVTRQPQQAQTLLQVKLEFFSDAIPTTIQLAMSMLGKGGAI